MLLDSTFLIDDQRGTFRGRPRRAYGFLDANPETLIQISVITCGEIAEEFTEDRREAFEDLIRPYAVVEVTAQIAWRFGLLSRRLRESGERIGDNDLWIAATALNHQVPLVSPTAAILRAYPVWSC